MVPKILRLAPILLSLGLAACEGQKEAARKERFNKDNFFSGIEKTGAVAELENEMAGAETDFLRSFATDSIPWQHWDSSILEKASNCQAPVFLLVGSSLGGDSRPVGQEISETPELRALIADQFVCSVADIHAHPELGILADHLSSEMNRPTSFPTLIWMSHEGAPIAWIPISGLSGRELGIVFKNAAAMVSKIWLESSEYAVNNSRSDNRNRQNSFEYPVSENATEEQDRAKIFGSQTRQLSSLYSAGDRDLDFIGALLPTSSLELLALGSITNAVTEEVNERCLRATIEVIEEILKGALKDHLDGSYFYARRTTDWSLPSFSKSIITQAKVIHMLIQAGSATGRQDFIDEALRLLDILQSDWLEKSRVQVTTAGDQDVPGKFLWNWSTLEKVIGRDLVPFAAAAFSLDKDGNIPSEVDPLGTFFRLNSLRSRISISDLAIELGLTEPETQKTLSEVKSKMLAYREKKAQFVTESVITCTDFALILRAWTAAAVVSNNHSDLLEKARSLADRLSQEFIDSEKGLSRLPLRSGFIPARASDYGAAAIALNELYQITLNPDYIKLSKELIDEAFEKLQCDNGLVSEAPSQDRVIPLEIIQPRMIFSDSSLGLIDLAVTQIKGVTGSKEYDEFRKKVKLCTAPMAEVTIVNHTDFISTCAYGDIPITAVVQGDPSTELGQNLLLTLNSKKHLPFLSIRPETGPAPLAALTNLPPASGVASVVLMRGEKILGQALDVGQLEQLISKALFARD
jgi:uncharacterized protein YyaL (SSP411 family)